jgi:Zn-finger nucleic acid-binding protein
MLKCPNCGAAAGAGDVACGYCDVQLQTVACASCLGMIFVGSKHCQHCGARVFDVAATATAATERRCPRCAHALSPTAIGSAILEECGGCGGVWVDAQSFAELSRSREEQAAYVGAGSPLPAPGEKRAEAHVQYVKCPDCGAVMNRVNFARWSGVIVDVCKRHGTWFDRDELRQIVEFIRSGGLDATRDKERRELELEKQRLKERERGGFALPLGDDGDFSLQFVRWLVKE